MIFFVGTDDPTAGIREGVGRGSRTGYLHEGGPQKPSDTNAESQMLSSSQGW